MTMSNDDAALAYTPMIKDMPATERPRERLRDYGAGALSTGELLAIILRTGIKGQNVLNLANRLLSSYGGLSGLAKANLSELQGQKGLGLAKSCDLKAALELGRRLAAEHPEERPTVASPQDVLNLLGTEMSLLEQEQLRVILLDTRNRVLAIPTVYTGNVNTSLIRVGELFRDAVRHNAVAIVVVHNHPSGDPAPSSEDVAVTRLIVEAGKLLNIDVLDHIVIAGGRCVSLKERRLGMS
jgi:DNA repair protein RadC